MIGIFGGTFDPIHYGHLRAALEVKEILGLDQVRMVLSAKPPHRPSPITPVETRLDMLRLALSPVPGFIADTTEMERAGQSYMVITLASLRREFPVQPLLLCIGIDAFNKLESWHQWQRLFDFAHVVVLTRPGYSAGALSVFFQARLAAEHKELSAHLAGKLYFQPITQLDISATAIRTMLDEGRSPRFLLPDAVLTYINEHNLYRSTCAGK